MLLSHTYGWGKATFLFDEAPMRDLESFPPLPFIGLDLDFDDCVDA